VGTRKPDGYGFRQNFKPVMGTSFLMGVNIFHGYGFEIAKPGGFVPVAISTSYPPSFSSSFEHSLSKRVCLRSGACTTDAPSLKGPDVCKHRVYVRVQLEMSMGPDTR
jgi:hypothetical protein